MIKILECTSFKEADDLSRLACRTPVSPENVTTHKWPVIKHPKQDKYAIELQEGDEENKHFTPEQKSKIKVKPEEWKPQIQINP